MTLGERIEARRKAIGIHSQAELARRAKIPQTTMNGLVNRPYRWSPHLTRLARQLHTTVAYLSGETDDPDEGAETGQQLSSDEAEWLEAYAGLTVQQRRMILALARDLARGNSPSTRIHDVSRDFMHADGSGL